MKMKVRHLKVAALNAHSLGSEGRLDEIGWLLTEQKVEVLAINETWQTEGEHFELEGYRYVGKPRTSARKAHGGGVGFFIANHLRFKIRQPNTPVPENCEMLAITVFLKGQRSIHLVSTYIPPHESMPKRHTKFEPATFARCFALPRCIFLGDFNAFHKDWSLIDVDKSNYATKRGTAIRKFARQKGMSIFGFPQEPTHINTKGGMSSPDLFLVGGEVAPAVLYWKTLTDVGSDHLPIMMELRLDAHRGRGGKRKKRWEGKTLNVEEYQKEIATEMAEWLRENRGQRLKLGPAVENWGERVLKACHKTCQARKMGHRPGVGFMSREVKALLTRRNAARKRSQRLRTPQSVIEFQKLQKKARKAVAQAKKDEHENFCNSFTKENAHAKVKKLKTRSSLPTCIHTPEGAILTDDKEIANHTCNYFATVGKGESKNQEGGRERESRGAERRARSG